MPRLPSLPSKTSVYTSAIAFLVLWFTCHRLAPEPTDVVMRWLGKALVFVISMPFKLIGHLSRADRTEWTLIGITVAVIALLVLLRGVFSKLLDLIGVTDFFSGRFDWLTRRRILGFIIAAASGYVLFSYVFFEDTPFSSIAAGTCLLILGGVIWLTLQNFKYRSMVGANQTRYDFTGEEE